jgi:hypothetical protein
LISSLEAVQLTFLQLALAAVQALVNGQVQVERQFAFRIPTTAQLPLLSVRSRVVRRPILQLARLLATLVTLALERSRAVLLAHGFLVLSLLHAR